MPHFEQYPGKRDRPFAEALRPIPSPTPPKPWGFSEARVELELKALREEIRMLREELSPTPSLIITGRAVVLEFAKLKGGGK